MSDALTFAALPEPPDRRAFERTGRSAVERLAILAVARDVAAMPASLVVQLALWPGDLAHWARAERVSESLVYNTLAARKPYARVRQLLAGRLDVSLAVVGHLIDARRPLPTVQREPGQPLVVPDPAVDWSEPPFPPVRDGGNPIERRAVRATARDVAAMPASTVAGLALWPETLTAWARAERLKSSVVWATLAGSPSDPVRERLARRLGVSARELATLIDGRRRTPAAQQAWAVDRSAHDALLADALARAADPAPPQPDPPAVRATDEGPEVPGGPHDPVPERPRRRRAPSAPPDDQISLGL
jgi:hypothetical protein